MVPVSSHVEYSLWCGPRAHQVFSDKSTDSIRILRISEFGMVRTSRWAAPYKGPGIVLL